MSDTNADAAPVTQPDEQRFSLPAATLQAMLDYLSTRPFKEVADMLMAAHQQIQVVVPPEPEAPKEAEPAAKGKAST